MSSVAAPEASERGLAERLQPHQLSRSHGVVGPPTTGRQPEVCTLESRGMLQKRETGVGHYRNTPGF